jgi:hypothetical protein
MEFTAKIMAAIWQGPNKTLKLVMNKLGSQVKIMDLGFRFGCQLILTMLESLKPSLMFNVKPTQTYFHAKIQTNITSCEFLPRHTQYNQSK